MLIKVIKFYSISDEFGEFSNFAKFPVKIKKKTWPTSEHYFQAMKFDSKEIQEKIRKCKRPDEAARIGRDRKLKIKKNWDSSRDNVMREVVKAKFTQYEELKALLLSTGDAKLIEHTKNDDYWADGGDGKGKNMLGKILMEVREKLNV